MRAARMPRPVPVVLLTVALAATAAAETGVLVLRDGLRSEYGFCPEDERGGWGERHPCLPLFRAGVLDYAHRFARYLADSPGLRVRTLDVETARVDLPLGGIGLVILDDVRADAVKPFAQQLVDFAERGGALIVIGGFFGFGGSEPNGRFSMTKRPSDYRQTALARVLPVAIAASPDYVAVRKPTLALDGDGPLGAGIDPGSWPLYGYHRTKARTTAKVLATIDGHPLVAYHAAGRGLVVAFTGSELETAYANWKADPWPDEPVFWQRVAALALGVLDVRVEWLAARGPSAAPLLQAQFTVLGAAARQVDLEAWVANEQGARWGGARSERFPLTPGQHARWPFRLDPAGSPPGTVLTAVARAVDPRRDGALYTARARWPVRRPEGAPKATIAAPDSVRRGADLAVVLEAGLPLQAVVLRDGTPLARAELAKGTTRLTLRTRALRPGPYLLAAVNGQGQAFAARRVHVADYDPHFQNLLWWGQGDFPDGSALRRHLVRDLLAHRVGAGAPTDLCERHGFWAMRTLGGIGALSKFAGADKRPEAQWTDAAGKRRGKLCFNDPLFAEALPKWADSLTPGLAKLHSLGILHIEDEAGCPDCYCEDCRRLFKEKHGYEMPRPRKGVAPSPAFLDKWVARMDFKLATFSRYHKAVRDAFKQRLPHATVLTSLPQGFTVAHGETVLDHQRHLDAFWEHTYPGTEPLGAALAAHRVEMAAAALGAPERPFIHLLQGFDDVGRVPKMPTRDYVRLISWMALSHGADHLGWFVYRWMWWHLPGTEAWDACGETAAQLERLAPTLARLAPHRYPIALLYPLSQEMADHLRTQTATDAELPQRAVWTWRVWHSYEDAYFTLKLAGLPVEPLYEQGVMAGKLRYAAIVVPHADFLRREVVAGLRKFIDDGGAVFLGASSSLKLPGATTLPVDFLTLFNTYFPPGRRADWQTQRVRSYWLRPVLDKGSALRTLLAPYAKNPVVVSEPEVVWNLRDGGTTKYLFLLNDKTTNPMTAAQRSMRGRYAHFAILPMAYHRARVEVSVPSPGPVYDVLRGKRVAWPERGGRATFEADLEGGGARLYALLPERIRSVRVATRKAIEAGEPLPLHVGVWGRGHLLRGVVPLRITLEAGGRTRTLHAATRAGECHAELPTDVELPPGTARLTATELLSGRSASRRLRLLPPKPLLTPTP